MYTLFYFLCAACLVASFARSLTHLLTRSFARSLTHFLRYFAVRPSWDGQVVSRESSGDRGRLHLLRNVFLGPGEQVAGREREAGQADVRDGARGQAVDYLHRRDRLAVHGALGGGERVLQAHQDGVPRAGRYVNVGTTGKCTTSAPGTSGITFECRGKVVVFGC
jgi:hypothetical protein